MRVPVASHIDAMILARYFNAGDSGIHEIWVIHPFQKKSTRGIKMPQRQIDLIRERLKRLREISG
jgi:phage-related protein